MSDMKVIQKTLICAAIFASFPAWAQTPTSNSAQTSPQNPTPTYGDNPNIFKVLGHKAQQKAQNTVERVDQAAQKGVGKIKPKVSNAWEETKVFTAEQSTAVKEKSQHAATTIQQKVSETKADIVGSPDAQPAPIITHPLSESSTVSPAQTSP